MTVPDYQIIVNAVATMLVIGFPIFLILELAIKFMNILLDFIGGKKRVNL